MIKYSGETISGMHYSGYTIVRAYGCGGELVFGTTPPTPTGTKVIYTISGTSYTIPCDYDPVIDKIEILQDMSRKGLPIQDETSAMTDVVIGDCVTTISANTFNRCEALTSITIPNSVTTIGHDTFKECIVLPSITLPSGITTIEDGLFETNFMLSSVTIPNSVTAICENAFYDNLSLMNIEIPSGVTSIGQAAFRCQDWVEEGWRRDKMLQVASGRSVTIYATTPPTLDTGDEFSIFTGSDDIAIYPIYVPCASVDAYKAAWSQYASRIQPIGSCLPSGYTEVEYIENPSMAYIDTGFKPNQDTRITCEMQIVTSTDNGNFCGSGAWNKVNAMRFDYERYATGTLHISWGTVNGWTVYSACVGDYNKHTYDWDKNSFYRDGTLIGSVTYGNFQCTDNLGIFAPIEAGITPSQNDYMRGKLYDRFRIYDDGGLVRDYVPAKRDSDNKYGLYDLVNNTFNTSATNVEFVGGNPV